jgi:hypothetical protein
MCREEAEFNVVEKESFERKPTVAGSPATGPLVILRPLYILQIKYNLSSSPSLCSVESTGFIVPISHRTSQ